MSSTYPTRDASGQPYPKTRAGNARQRADWWFARGPEQYEHLRRMSTRTPTGAEFVNWSKHRCDAEGYLWLARAARARGDYPLRQRWMRERTKALARARRYQTARLPGLPPDFAQLPDGLRAVTWWQDEAATAQARELEATTKALDRKARTLRWKAKVARERGQDDVHADIEAELAPVEARLAVCEFHLWELVARRARADVAATRQQGANVSASRNMDPVPGCESARRPLGGPPSESESGGGSLPSESEDEAGVCECNEHPRQRAGERPWYLEDCEAGNRERRTARAFAQALGSYQWARRTLEELRELPDDGSIYTAQRIARRVYRSTSTRLCGVSDTGGGRVELATGPGGSYVRGVTRCDSVARCPMCSKRIGARRAADMTEVLVGLVNAGYSVTVGCSTIRHDRGHDLCATYDVVQESWRALQQGRAWVNGSERFGILGGFRVTEVTVDRPEVWHDPWMPSQWHPHVHWLVVHDKGTSEEVGEWMGQRWCTVVGNVANTLGVDRVTPDDAAQWHEPLRSEKAIAGYLTKALGAAMELSGSWASKLAGGGRCNPGQLLFAAKAGSARAIAQLREYEDATTGRRTWGVFGRQKMADALARLGVHARMFARKTEPEYSPRVFGGFACTGHELESREPRAAWPVSGENCVAEPLALQLRNRCRAPEEAEAPTVLSLDPTAWREICGQRLDGVVRSALDTLEVWPTYDGIRAGRVDAVPVEVFDRLVRCLQRGVGEPRQASELVEAAAVLSEAIEECVLLGVQPDSRVDIARRSLRMRAASYRETVKRREPPALRGRMGNLAWVRACESSDTARRTSKTDRGGPSPRGPSFETDTTGCARPSSCS